MQHSDHKETLSNTVAPGTTVPNPIDIELNKPSKSKFLFHLGFLGFFIFIAGCGYGLWQHKYRTTSTQEVPESTSYNPKYK
jgi:hypothetical protein